MVIVAIAALALLPTVRIVYTLGVIGENNLSNDAGPLLSRFLTPVMAGSYNWLHFPRDTFINTHSNIFPGIVFILLAYLFRLDAHAILYLGVVLAVIRLWLLKEVIGRCCGPNSLIWRGALWLTLASLIFSISQMSVYEFPVLTIKYGVSNLGTALGVWGLTRFRERLAGVWLAATGGLLATFSNATGFALWPAFLIGMWLLGFRKVRYFLVLAAAAVISMLPFVAFLFLGKDHNTNSTILSLFRPVLILNILGRPFANHIGFEFGPLHMAEAAAAIGLVLCLLAAILLWAWREKCAIQSVAPLVTLIAAGLFTACQISLFRNQVSPWYTGVVMDFWIGLAGLAFAFWHKKWPQPGMATGRPYGRPARAWSIATISIIAVLYLASNRTRADKSFYVYSRSPVSAACLRKYRTAPTYCECSLARWLPGNPAYMEMLGRPLQENHLSVFAPHQEWSLQGDSILDNVEYKQPTGAGEIYWVAGIGGDRAPFTDYRKLDLVLAPLDSVSWTVEIPANLEHAEFQSALAVCPLQSSSETAPASCKVSLQTAGEGEGVAYSRILDPGDSWWSAFRIPLDRYAGKITTITLTLEGHPDAPAKWGAMFQYPVIDLFLNDPVGQERNLGPILPSNTDLSPNFVKEAPNDFQVNLSDAAAWNTGSPEHSTAGPVGTWSISNADSRLRYISPLSIRLGDYSHLYIQVSASKDVLPRAMFLILTFDGEPAPQERSAAIPLLADDGPHDYTLDLRLFDMPSSSRVTGIALQPLAPGLTSGNPVIQISELRFIRR